jgi:deoxyribose-phosphate aldolase
VNNIKGYTLHTEGKAKQGNTDLYLLQDTLTEATLRDVGRQMVEGNYRKVAAFAHAAHLLEKLPCGVVALVNYPPERFTKHALRRDILAALRPNVDDIEFVWHHNYNRWEDGEWRDLVLTCAERGVLLRPMLEIAKDDDAYVAKSLRKMRAVGMRSVCTSTGLVEQTTTLERYLSVRDMVPNTMSVKVIASPDTPLDGFTDAGVKLFTRRYTRKIA